MQTFVFVYALWFVAAEGTAPLITPSSGAIPLGRIGAEFTCVYGGQFEQWLVSVPSFGGVLALLPNGAASIAPDLLRSKGIAMAPDRPQVLLVNATSLSNGSSVVCTATENGTARNSDPVIVAVFDRPSPPVINFAPYSVGALMLFWKPSLSFVNVTYSVSVADSNGSTAAFLRIGPLVRPEYVYQYPATVPPLCVRYQFTVTAKNDAGESDPSQPIVASLPSVPQFAGVPVSFVAMTPENVTVHFQSAVARVCSDYSVWNYSIHVYDDTATGFSIDGFCKLIQNGTTVVFITSELNRNSKYNFYITAFNQFGNSSTSIHSVYTTDVQSSAITVTNDQLNVTCSFAEGSLAKGCVVLLERSGEVVQQMISRVNGTARGVITTELSVGCYNISAVDWEEDGSFGSLKIPATVSYEEHVGCISLADYRASAKGAPLIVVVSSAIVGGSVLIAALLAIIVVASFVRIRRTSRERRVHEKLTSSNSWRTTASTPI